ncbi:hypothetical protein MMC14_002840 [Varicellaria rhodocarpa]|nr:hypothetical protein [Varicellaria rhodocarpa]
MLSRTCTRHLAVPLFHELSWNSLRSTGAPLKLKPFILSSSHRCTASLSKPSVSTTVRDTGTPSLRESQDEGTHSKHPPTRHSLRPLIYAATFLVIGLTVGQYIRFVILPPPLPLPDSHEDSVFLRVLQKDAEKLPLIQELRSHPDHWVEIDSNQETNGAERKSSLTLGTMGGSRGLGINKVFWNERERRTISIVFLGGALAGWPGVTHGGAIATVLEDNLRRLINMSDSTATVTNKSPYDNITRLKRMELKYLKPTLANQFFAIRTEFEESKAATENHARIVQAMLEEVGTGAVCVAATGLC